jgi:hypothetical protein
MRCRDRQRPWRLYQSYALDVFSLKCGSLEDGTMRFRSLEPSFTAPERVPATGHSAPSPA